MQNILTMYYKLKNKPHKLEQFKNYNLDINPLFDHKEQAILCPESHYVGIIDLYDPQTVEYRVAVYIISSLYHWFCWADNKYESIAFMRIHNVIFDELSELLGNLKYSQFDKILNKLIDNNLIIKDNNYKVNEYSKGYYINEYYNNDNIIDNNNIIEDNRDRNGVYYYGGGLRECKMILIREQLFYKRIPKVSLFTYINAKYSMDINHIEDNLISQYRYNLELYSFDAAKLNTIYEEMKNKKDKKMMNKDTLTHLFTELFEGCYEIKRGDKSGRIYTSMHSVKREFRQAIIRKDGKEVYSSDITNSQMTILLALCKERKINVPKDIEKLILDGTIYQELGQYLNIESGAISYNDIINNKDVRSEVKAIFYSFLFDSSIYIDKDREIKFHKINHWAQWYNVFAKYPSFKKWIEEVSYFFLDGDGNSTLASMLQGIETDIVCNIALPLGCITLHDMAIGTHEQVEKFNIKLRDFFLTRYNMRINVVVESSC